MSVGYQAQDHRASLAHAARREQAGDTVERCNDCRCELDVAVVAHAPRCQEAT